MIIPMVFSGSDGRLIGLAGTLMAVAAVTNYAHVGGTVVPFIASGAALALLASLVGRSVEQVGERLGAGATGVVQSALGNLPELFVVLFALKSGLYEVATATIVGSILANVLLVLGLAFVAGGVRHGVQRFDSAAARRLSLMLTLSVAALVVPALTALLHTPAAGHERGLSIVVSVLLLALFALSLPASLKKQEGPAPENAAAAEVPEADGSAEQARWPLWVAGAMLAVTGVAAAFVSDWFVAALTPAMDSLHISQAFAGLVIVAIAGNAVENVVGIQLAHRNQPDHALSVILQSPIQIAMMVAPALVLLSPLVGASFTLVLPPLLLVALLLAVVVTIVVVLDGDSNWLEGAALVTLYVIIATAFWWG
ncbi:calcium/proton exchanger [Nocardia seriolae]|uniref:Ca(2+)/H(+) antiporter n=2 Tax=Nocardia seriolae TaxID=37332 RepID=A0ABC9YWG7_9NOCA|nr:calcium/proton exchanger [Nocardia seriolae]BEK94733.1 calcium/proton exchanger [Nocardia seriolae]GAM47968.1 sodium:proton exchanger [Nocardia seriolae]GAP29854.1 sodium:proton exchanger [Nocardia seriolae]GEM25358.1 calcium/proton exchanger [Nocardia seriolae NBRC 15557]